MWSAAGMTMRRAPRMTGTTPDTGALIALEHAVVTSDPKDIRAAEPSVLLLAPV